MVAIAAITAAVAAALVVVSPPPNSSPPSASSVPPISPLEIGCRRTTASSTSSTGAIDTSSSEWGSEVALRLATQAPKWTARQEPEQQVQSTSGRDCLVGCYVWFVVCLLACLIRSACILCVPLHHRTGRLTQSTTAVLTSARLLSAAGIARHWAAAPTARIRVVSCSRQAARVMGGTSGSFSKTAPALETASTFHETCFGVLLQEGGDGWCGQLLACCGLII